MSKKIIVFDFDGVLLDSSTELVITGFNLCSDHLVKSVEEVDPDFFKRMRLHLNYARNGGETSTLAMLMHKYHDFNMSRSEFDDIVKSSRENGELLKVQSDYFDARRRLLKSDRKAWLNLNHPAQPIWDFLCKNMQGKISILTYKNPDAVVELCEHFGLSIKEVFAIPSGITKANKLKEIAKDTGAEVVYYVDDAYKNLVEISSEIKELDVRYLWASWGYGYEASMAKEGVADIKAITQEDLIQIISNIL